MKTKNLFLIAAILAFSVPALAAETPLVALVSGCQASDFVFVESPAMIGIVGKTYSPKCIKVKVGATVTVHATPKHPSQGVPTTDGSVNPFVNNDGGKNADVTVVMSTAGTFGFFCMEHGESDGTGMAGAVLVE